MFGVEQHVPASITILVRIIDVLVSVIFRGPNDDGGARRHGGCQGDDCRRMTELVLPLGMRQATGDKQSVFESCKI